MTPAIMNVTPSKTQSSGKPQVQTNIETEENISDELNNTNEPSMTVNESYSNINPLISTEFYDYQKLG